MAAEPCFAGEAASGEITMHLQLPAAGAASAEVAQIVHQAWTTEAAKIGIVVTEFDPASPLSTRLAVAQSQGLQIGCVLSRYSSKLQHSTIDQVQECVRFAAGHQIYTPPEFVCVDEGVSGRKVRRDGLNRVKLILRNKLARVLLVFKVSRLFRVAYRGFQFFQEELVEEDLRAISISQGIDTANDKTWKQLAYLHGIMDEMLVATIADHVRSGIAGLFRAGYVVGALTVGYRAKEVPGAPTNRGRPRTAPEIDPAVAECIVQHFEWIRDGMPIRQGWLRWVRDNGPCDPRSTTGYMTYPAYRRMLSNPRYTGRWAFGQKRNQWSAKRDYTRQVVQPDTDVMIVESDELRIVADELYFAVQKHLEALKVGARGHKSCRPIKLWDLVTDCFFCACCSTPEKPVRFYQAGANGNGMRCKRADVCKRLTVVRRVEAVCAVCKKLIELLQQDATFIEQTITGAQQLDPNGDDALHKELDSIERKLSALGRKIDDLTELAGEGSYEDRAALKAKVRAAQVERAALQVERSRLRHALENSSLRITPQQVRDAVAHCTTLLEGCASGELSGEVVYRAATIFRKLVEDRIEVHVERRAGRKRTNVYGVFTPKLLQTVREQLQDVRRADQLSATPARVWLRKPPKRDELAKRVYELIDVGRLSYRAAASTLQAEGHNINSGVVWQIRRRYFEMQGLPVPELPYNNGKMRDRPPASNDS
jgi:DNA invertase Pin-like site-specific DNA recombinase